jgi:hypothetical protein
MIKKEISQMNNVEKRGFKRKTIIQTITRKMDKWIASINDKELAEKVTNDYIVTGGAIASMLLGELPNDFDVYMQTPEIALELANYYISTVANYGGKVGTVEARIIKTENASDNVEIFIKSAGVVRSEDENFNDYDYFEHDNNGTRIESFLDKDSFKEKKNFSLALITSNAISLHGDVQIVLRFVGPPAKIHKNYDFIHVTNYYTTNEGLVLNSHAMEAILAKELKYVGSLYPICSMFRIKKFLNRGWTITAGEMLKIAWDISKLDLEDMNVLYDQLCGVDVAYFNQLINILKDEKKEGFDRSYLFELINRVFDGNSKEEDEFHELVGE